MPITVLWPRAWDASTVCYRNEPPIPSQNTRGKSRPATGESETQREHRNRYRRLGSPLKDLPLTKRRLIGGSTPQELSDHFDNGKLLLNLWRQTKRPIISGVPGQTKGIYRKFHYNKRGNNLNSLSSMIEQYIFYTNFGLTPKENTLNKYFYLFSRK